MKACYAIIKTRSFYGVETEISLVGDDTGSHYLSFSTSDEARAWIRQLTNRKHNLRQNDTTPPTYAITEVGNGNFCDAYKCTWGESPERILVASSRKPPLRA
jgi:hypothetical protein